MQVTCNPGKPAKPAELEGTLIIEMLVVNPVNHLLDTKHKFKRLTLARHHCLTYGEAGDILDKFKELNRMSIKPEYINAQWVVRKFL
jgi:hypothetical protein